jgi:hypothetical protein
MLSVFLEKDQWQIRKKLDELISNILLISGKGKIQDYEINIFLGRLGSLFSGSPR